MALAADTKKPYGEVSYADPGYQEDKQKRYPLDTEAHCRAAWSYINMDKNASKYSPEQLAAIKERIRSAGKKLGVEFADSSAGSGRSEDPVPWSDMIVRSIQMDDLSVKRGAFSCERCGKDATGRMVDGDPRPARPLPRGHRPGGVQHDAGPGQGHAQHRCLLPPRHDLARHPVR
jgi:hypothetical protein